jgi:hypothetical protein
MGGLDTIRAALYLAGMAVSRDDPGSARGESGFERQSPANGRFSHSHECVVGSSSLAGQLESGALRRTP